MVWFVKKKTEMAPETASELVEGQTALKEELPPMPMSPLPLLSQKEELPELPEQHNAPLFIKVERYKELLSYLGALKSDIETLKQLGNVLNSAQEMFNETNKALGATLNKTNKLISAIDSELGRPQGMDIGPEPDSKMAEMKISLNELGAQLEKLKTEVKAISE